MSPAESAAVVLTTLTTLLVRDGADPVEVHCALLAVPSYRAAAGATQGMGASMNAGSSKPMFGDEADRAVAHLPPRVPYEDAARALGMSTKTVDRRARDTKHPLTKVRDEDSGSSRRYVTRESLAAQLRAGKILKQGGVK